MLNIFSAKALRILSLISFVFFLGVNKASAQQKKAVTYQQQIESQRLARSGYKPIPVTTLRILADFEYSNTRPSNLNDNRSRVLWNGTTPTVGTFSSPMGFKVGIGYSIWNGFVGINFGRISEELGVTNIPSTTTSVRDGFELEQISVSYDYVIQDDPEYSYELGGAVGYATKFRFYNYLENNGTSEVINWSDNPMLIRLSGSFNYHFSEHVRARVGIGYELATSSSLKSEEAHPAQTIIQGQNLLDADGNNLKVDFSGLRANAGLIVSF